MEEKEGLKRLRAQTRSNLVVMREKEERATIQKRPTNHPRPVLAPASECAEEFHNETELVSGPNSSWYPRNL